MDPRRAGLVGASQVDEDVPAIQRDRQTRLPVCPLLPLNLFQSLFLGGKNVFRSNEETAFRNSKAHSVWLYVLLCFRKNTPLFRLRIIFRYYFDSYWKHFDNLFYNIQTRKMTMVLDQPHAHTPTHTLMVKIGVVWPSHHCCTYLSWWEGQTATKHCTCMNGREDQTCMDGREAIKLYVYR